MLAERQEVWDADKARPPPSGQFLFCFCLFGLSTVLKVILITATSIQTLGATPDRGLHLIG